MIYLDHNATSPLHPKALDAMMPYLTYHWGNPSSPHRFGAAARTALEKARACVADCIGCNLGEIIFCSSGTEADNLALRGAAAALKSKGNHIITCAIEHHAVLNTCRALEKDGFKVTLVPVDSNGIVCIKTLEQSLRSETVLLSVMHANNETGAVQPIEEISLIAKSKGIAFHCDAVQTVGKLPFNLRQSNLDYISFSAHKLYGPKGVGALYIKNGAPFSSIITGGSHEHSFRAGTENVAGIVGFAMALQIATENLESEAHRLSTLRNQLETEIEKAIPRIKINSRNAPRISNTSNITVESVDGESVVLGMDLFGFCISTGSACSTGEPEPSHVLTAMGLSPRDAQSSIRFSLGKDTKEADINAAVGAAKKAITRLRSVSSI